MNDNDIALFDIAAPEVKAEQAIREPQIRPEQIQEIRAAFDSTGITEQGNRKALIESVVLREVDSLRQLRSIDAQRILQRLEQRASPSGTPTGSAWDNREEDTWIDKL
ncbi:hypothetical protein ACX80S_12310 [Arthrobacter sp. RHLT1-20]